MTQRIHTSPWPSVFIPEQSVFTQILPENDPFDPASEAFTDAVTGVTLSRGQLRDLSLQIGHGLTEGGVLASRGGPVLRRGSVLAIYSPNCLSFVLALYAGFASGVKVSPANSGYTPTELAHQLKLARADAVVVHPLFLNNLLEAFKILGVNGEQARTRIILATWNEKLDQPVPSGYTKLDDLIGKGKLPGEARFDGRYSHETALICFSSGTTGLAKGVETTHKNLVSILSIFPDAWAKWKPGEDRMLGVLPAYHIYAAVKVCLFPASQGVGTIVLPKFEPILFGTAVSRYRVTYLPIVPPILVGLANSPIFEQFDWSSVKTLTSGGAPLGADLVNAVVKKMRQMGAPNVRVSQGYGLTETSPTSHFNPIEHFESKAGTIGPLLPNLEARIVKEDGGDAADGERGELWIRGPTIMKGYLDNPTATLECITPDGWFQTGDIAIREADGWYSIVDRKKELIKYKGFQVPPADLEALLLTHSDVVDAGVIGVYDDSQATELPRAYVVPRGGTKLFATKESRKQFEQAVARWVSTKVAKHKWLRGGVIIIDEVPKSAAGKILRKELRERAKKELEAEPLPTQARL